MRSTIFELHQLGSELQTLRNEIITICDESAATLGFRPTREITGPIDSAVNEQVRGHLLLCLREALSNVARHAQAKKVDVKVDVDVRIGRLI